MVEAKKENARADSAGPDDVIRVETALAVFDILALDKDGRAVMGLSKDDFVIAEDGKAQEVASTLAG